MPKVIQIRDMPGEVHNAVARSAQPEGPSLTEYTPRELKHVVAMAHVAGDAAATLRRTQPDPAGPRRRSAALRIAP